MTTTTGTTWHLLDAVDITLVSEELISVPVDAVHSAFARAFCARVVELLLFVTMFESTQCHVTRVAVEFDGDVFGSLVQFELRAVDVSNFRDALLATIASDGFDVGEFHISPLATASPAAAPTVPPTVRSDRDDADEEEGGGLGRRESGDDTSGSTFLIVVILIPIIPIVVGAIVIMRQRSANRRGEGGSNVSPGGLYRTPQGIKLQNTPTRNAASDDNWGLVMSGLGRGGSGSPTQNPLAENPHSPDKHRWATGAWSQSKTSEL